MQLAISPATFSAELSTGEKIVGAGLDLDFPDYRRILHDQDRPGASVLQVPVSDILADLTGRSEAQVHLSGRGVHDPTMQDPTMQDPTMQDPSMQDPMLGAAEAGLLVDRAFLWEAASTLGEGYAVLPADGEIAPLVLREADGRLASLLMPLRLDPA